MFVSEVYLERLLTSRVPAAETVFGGLVWVAIVTGFVRNTGDAAWMLSALVGVPLALRLAGRETAGPTTASIPWLRVFSVPAAFVGSLSLLAPGPIAFLLSLPWLCLTLLVAVAGSLRFLSRRSINTPMVAMDIGLVMIGITGLALTLSHLGLGAFWNPELISILYLIPVIAAECVRHRQARWWSAPLLALGVPLGFVAVSYGEVVRLVGVGIFALTCTGVAILTIRTGADRSKGPRTALTVGGVAVGFGAGLLLVAEAFAFFDLAFDVTGDAVDLMRTLDGPLIVFGPIPTLFGLVLLPAELRTGRRRTFFHIGPPTLEQLSRLDQEMERQEPRAAVNPLVEEAPDGFRLHRISRPVPNFDNSCEALWTWAGHEAAGIELTPAQPAILMGKNFVATVPVGPITITSTGRVVALISDEDHYGFVYSTLDHHPFVGTEAIMLDRSSGRASITISTVWRPNCLATKLMSPIANKVLDHIVGGYLDGIAEAETATIESRMMDLVSDMSKRRYEISREAIRSESPLSLPAATDVIDEVETQPLSAFEALFEHPLHGPSEEVDEGPIEDPLL